MSDTTLTFAGKTTRISGSLKAVLLYVIADACVSLGQAFGAMERADWDSMWALQRVGFFLSQIGSTALIVKAFYSGSSPIPPKPTI